MKKNSLDTNGGVPRQKTVVVIGNGMVGHRFCEKLVEFDADRNYRLVTFCEEARAAYDRVGLTQFFAHRDAQRLMLANREWYRQNSIDLHIGDRVSAIDQKKHIVRSEKGTSIAYDVAVLATGSYPFVPPVPGIKKLGVFVYRTIEDLERIIAYAPKVRRAAVIGGGLLGLEAAKAALDLGLETHVVEFAPRLMPRQLDEAGSQMLVSKIEQLGVHVHLNKATEEVLGNGAVDGMTFSDGSQLDVEMIIVSAGIRPRDDLARECGIEVGPRGGVVVDDGLKTSAPDIYAIGEVALHGSTIYGLVSPGYQMAEIVAANLIGEQRSFTGSDMSTKLKLMGVDVASFGNIEVDENETQSVTFTDSFRGTYQKLLFNPDGSKLLGGILVGDASSYGRLLMLSKSDQPLTVDPSELLRGKQSGASAGSVADLDDAAQICSCNNVLKSDICTAVRDQQLTTVGEVTACTKAGAGCGGCVPLVTDLLKASLKAAGKSIDNNLCEHFTYTRQELFEIIKVRQLKTFEEVVEACGTGRGCEICKPAVASILASLFNEPILDHAPLQDTNDRFLANIQRGGVYSVIPRVPGGEITPQKLITLGEVAQRFGLYTKVTGAQRVDLFGAAVHDLPDIWEELVEAGFESGHAYGKALRTVKSCVGTTWCRYGVGDSVGLAIRLEQRYRGVRAPHKIKAAVSGCVRECAEAQSKDFGLIAAEQGYNLYVCGNGGAKPRHADLLAADLDEETCIRYIDRFLMYYIQTSDKLTRTSVWLSKMPGGIERLREVVIHDRLKIADALEEQMQFLVDSYRCEWKDVLDDPKKRRLFRQFVNTDETESCIEFVSERDQQHPADWPADVVSLGELTLPDGRTLDESRPQADEAGAEWVRVGQVDDFPIGAGACIKHGKSQVAVYRFASGDEWYACQNMCPHKKSFVLSRGIVGDSDGVPKVACPLHKKTFSLESGQCTSDDDYTVRIFPVKVQGEDVYLELPPEDVLHEQLATEKFCSGTQCQTLSMQPA